MTTTIPAFHGGEIMTILPILLLAVVAGVWYLSMKIMQVTVDALANPSERIILRTHVPPEQDMRAPLRQAEDWAGEHGFKEDVMFDFQIASKEQSLFCRTWKNTGTRPIWFSISASANTSWSWSPFMTTKPE
jgi:hypothetical protein